MKCAGVEEEEQNSGVAGLLRERALRLGGGSVSLGRKTVALLIWGKMRKAVRCEEGGIRWRSARSAVRARWSAAAAHAVARAREAAPRAGCRAAARAGSRARGGAAGGASWGKGEGGGAGRERRRRQNPGRTGLGLGGDW